MKADAAGPIADLLAAGRPAEAAIRSRWKRGAEYLTDAVGQIRSEIRVLADTKHCPGNGSAEKSR